MKGPEARFSQEFAKVVKKHCPDVFGFRLESSHTCPGLPDWCLLIKGGRVVFVELKAGHTVTPAQIIIHRIMKHLQIEIYVLTKTISGVKVNNVEPMPLEYVISTIVENKQCPT